MAANPSLGDTQIRELFDRLDKDKNRRLQFDEIITALGDVLSPRDVEELRRECEGKGLTYEDFRWLLLRPRFGVTARGLQKLLGDKLSHREASPKVEATHQTPKRSLSLRSTGLSEV